MTDTWAMLQSCLLSVPQYPWSSESDWQPSCLERHSSNTLEPPVLSWAGSQRINYNLQPSHLILIILSVFGSRLSQQTNITLLRYMWRDLDGEDSIFHRNYGNQRKFNFLKNVKINKCILESTNKIVLIFFSVEHSKCILIKFRILYLIYLV